MRKGRTDRRTFRWSELLTETMVPQYELIRTPFNAGAGAVAGTGAGFSEVASLLYGPHITKKIREVEK